MPPSPSSALPDTIQSLFWEYDPGTLDWNADRDLIIRRVLSEGNWAAIAWLRRELDDDTLRTWMVERHGARLSPRQLRFWELVLDLPSDRVMTWITRQRPSVWTHRTRI